MGSTAIINGVTLSVRGTTLMSDSDVESRSPRCKGYHRYSNEAERAN